MKILRYWTYAALIAALFILVLPAAADCPDDDPRCTILPPVSQEVGDEKSGGSVEMGSTETNGLTPVESVVPMPPPPAAASASTTTSEDVSIHSPAFKKLTVPLRFQTPEDPTCGVQALGMAMDGLSGEAPSSTSLWNYLHGQGMTYTFGTGVEELAYAAQSFGYPGSLPFHDASLEDLLSELEAGRPVVVSLGSNGEDVPGHFVTLTGVSPDGSWVSYNDPTVGKVVLSREAFMVLWNAQGNSGVRVAKEPLVTAEGELNVAPWVAMAAGFMALVSTTPLVLKRRGIGGMLDPGGASGGSSGSPPNPPPPGYQWVKKLVTRYKLVWKQDGWTYETRSVRRYEKQRFQVGTTTIYDKIPVYKTVRVQDGWKTVLERVPQYKTVRYVKYHRTTRTRVKRYRYSRGRRYFAGYSYVTKRTPVYGTKQIFNGYNKVYKRVPNYVNKRVLSHYKVLETEVPKYEWRDVQVGWTTEKVRVPKMVQVREADGVEVRWVLARQAHSTGTTTPEPGLPGTPLSTPQPEPLPTPEQSGTPSPATYSTSISTISDETTSLIGNIVKWAKKVKSIWGSAGLAYNELPTGYYSVSAPLQEPGEKLVFRLKQYIPGTRYSSGGLATASATSLMKKWANGLKLSIGIPVAVNLIDYGIGEHSDVGLKSNEFAASTTVDIAQSGLTGLAAAGLVAGGVIVAGAIGLTAVASAPLWALALATAAVGVGAGVVVNNVVDTDKLKEDVAHGFSTFPGIIDNAKTIVTVGSERVSEAVEQTIQNVGDAISNTVTEVSNTVSEVTQTVTETVTNTVQSAADAISGFVNNLFGSGD